MSDRLVLSGAGWYENIDWTKYSSVFPARYIEESFADTFFHTQAIKRAREPGVKRIEYVLEVGCGLGVSNTTKFLSDKGAIVHTFDRYITGLPKGSHRHFVNKNELKKENKLYDMIIMRGSYNYCPLFSDEIIGNGKPTNIFDDCGEQLLHPDGVFVFNTFSEPETNYSYRSMKDVSGESVFEICIYEKEEGTIYHNLFTKDKVIRHKIRVIPEKTIRREYSDRMDVFHLKRDNSLYFAITFK